MTLKPLGDCAWLVEFPGLTGEAALARVMGLADALETDRPAGVLDVVASFDSLAVHFEGGDGAGGAALDPVGNRRGPASAGRGNQNPGVLRRRTRADLEEVAEKTGLSREEVVGLHCGAVYTVAAVGFSPGFPYLLGLPERSPPPRRATPRLAVPAGSVAVAGGQAGIYPFASPGGWHVLGRTGVNLFDPSHERPALLRSGDRVRFVPVDELEVSRKFLPSWSPPDRAGSK